MKIRKAFMVSECVVATVILGLLLSGMWFSLETYRTFNAIQMARMRCTAAAQAQLDHLAQSGESLDAKTVQTLWPGIALSTNRTPGQGAWEGTTLVTVQAEVDVEDRFVRMEFARYFPAAPRSQP